MEGLVKIVANVAVVTVAIGSIGYVAITIHAIWNGGVNYTWKKHKITWKQTEPFPKTKRPSWVKTFHILTMEKGPGRDNINQDFQYMVDQDEDPNAAICTCCGAHNDEIVRKRN